MFLTYIIFNPDLGWDGKFHWYKKLLIFIKIWVLKIYQVY